MQDFHPTDMFRFVSSGMDDTIKIWWLKGSDSQCCTRPERPPRADCMGLMFCR